MATSTEHKTLPVLNPKAISAFWAKVHRGEPDDCWPWLGARVRDGYGNFSYNNENYRASRIAYFLTHGDFDQSLLVRHKCDNPPCVNPAHLIVGSSSDNALDAHRRGRWQRFSSDVPVQLNYVIPPDLEEKLAFYSRQTGVDASALIRRLVLEYLNTEPRPLLPNALPHPRGKRTSLVLSEQVLKSLEERTRASGITKAALVATLLDQYLSSHATAETVHVEVDLSISTLDRLAAQFGAGEPSDLVRRALMSLTKENG